ncbi:imidazole glycerol phosphate synthase subunit HisH [Alphaproteobacteria bacterium]|nr:imidazole glycerol phosphate synthase subunit HisH [Alphaproteobacteria bacterium]MDB2324431.1 imidazole glycerol phosphate synthase subunit HisH [Alphaproteobacteria bacterium]
MGSVAVINCGLGNIQSVFNAACRVSDNVQLVDSASELLSLNIDRVILPGVGAVGRSLKHLRENGFETALKARVLEDAVPFLGICVGMQVLATTCLEFGVHDGLNLIPGTVRKLTQEGSVIKLPHVGWNQVHHTNDIHPSKNISGSDFYFVHSYYFDCEPEFVIAKTDYEIDFPSMIGRENIFGVQFHPEKSSKSGEKLLSCFINNGSL